MKTIMVDIAYTEKTTKVGLKNIEITYPKESKKEIRVLSSEEQRRFVAFLVDEPDVFKIGILISLVTGLRIGEICALRWREVSFIDKTIRITSTMQRIKNTDQNAETKTKIVIKDPKSDASERVIPITEFGLSLLRMLYRKGCTANSFVLTCREDKYIEPRVLQYHMGVYCKECRLQDVHFHTLRHPYVKHTTKIFSLRLMDFQAQAYPDARRKTRRACQLHRGGQSQSPVRPLCNRKRFS